MIKTHCQAIHNGIQCNARIPGTVKYHETYGNYCEDCIRQLNMKYTIKPTEETRKKWLEKLKVLRKLKKEAERIAGMTTHMTKADWLITRNVLRDEVKLLENDP